MARRKKPRPNQQKVQSEEQARPAEPAAASEAPKAASKPARKKRRRKRKARRAKARKPRVARGRRARRGRYSDVQRARIVATARRDGLTATEVEKRFGVKTVTFYSWAKKSRVGRGGRRRATRVAAKPDIAGQIQPAIRAKVQEVLDSVLRSEVERALAAFGVGRRR